MKPPGGIVPLKKTWPEPLQSRVMTSMLKDWAPAGVPEPPPEITSATETSARTNPATARAASPPHTPTTSCTG